MLIMADAFAVTWFRRHCQWPTLLKLAPSVVAGMALGGLALYWIGESSTKKDVMGIIIGVLILVMLALHFAKQRLGERFSLHSKTGTAASGAAAGFTTTVANAAGPVMGIYLTSAGLTKEAFIGTGAWYFFIVNTAKLPILATVTMLQPDKPLLTTDTLMMNLMLFPVIVLGAFLGRSALSKIPQKAFEWAVLVLAAAGALKLLMG